MNKTGCYNCECRRVGCHATCEIYKTYKENLNKINEARRIDNELRKVNKHKRRCYK